MNKENPQNKRYVTYTELAKMLHITYQAIAAAYKNGHLVKTAAGIDLANEINRYWIKRSQARRNLPVEPLYTGPEVKDHGLPEKITKQRIKRLKKENKIQVINDREKEILEKEQAIEEKNQETQINFAVKQTKDEADLARINAQTTKYNVKIAEDMKLLISRKLVEKMFGKLYSISQNQFLTLGERIAPIVAGICGTTDAEIILQIKNKIEHEISRTLSQVKNLTEVDL